MPPNWRASVRRLPVRSRQERKLTHGESASRRAAFPGARTSPHGAAECTSAKTPWVLLRCRSTFSTVLGVGLLFVAPGVEPVFAGVPSDYQSRAAVRSETPDASFPNHASGRPHRGRLARRLEEEPYGLRWPSR